MRIKFNWHSGWIDIDADAVIENMSMLNYRKFAKLFAQYGVSEQHEDFLNRLQIYINMEKTKVRLKEYQQKYKLLKGLVS